MSQSNLSKFFKLIKEYQYLLWAGAFLFVACVSSALWIYDVYAGHPKEIFWFKLADFLMAVGQTMLGTVLIGGGLGGVVNFVFEQQKKREDNIRKQLADRKEKQDRQKAFRAELRRSIQEAHDNVELARILIKSHRSGRTYGEQIRQNIMPANIAIQDVKDRLSQIQGESPVGNLIELQVSLTYMSAYLGVLIEEFSRHYLDIAMLQTYQDTVADRRRDVFTDLLGETDAAQTDDDARLLFLQKADKRMEELELPDRLAVVWKAMGRLDYVWDFIADLRDDKGKASKYQTFFVDHHYHCFRLLRDQENQRNERLCRSSGFKHYLSEQERLTEKKNSDQPITKHDSLTRIIMQHGLGFEFEEEK